MPCRYQTIGGTVGALTPYRALGMHETHYRLYEQPVRAGA